MKYIVILTMIEMVTPEPNAEEQLEVESTPILCDTVQAVCEAIAEADDNGNLEWSLWEVVDGKAKRRAITYPKDPTRAVIS